MKVHPGHHDGAQLQRTRLFVFMDETFKLNIHIHIAQSRLKAQFVYINESLLFIVIDVHFVWVWKKLNQRKKEEHADKYGKEQ